MRDSGVRGLSVRLSDALNTFSITGRLAWQTTFPSAGFSQGLGDATLLPHPTSLSVSRALYIHHIVTSLTSALAVFVRASDQGMAVGVLNFRLQTQVMEKSKLFTFPNSFLFF